MDNCRFFALRNPLKAIVFTLSLLATKGYCALVTYIEVNSPTEITISISGTLEPGGPDLPYLGIYPEFFDHEGGFALAYARDYPGTLMADGVFLSIANTGIRSGFIMELTFEHSLQAGNEFSGNQRLLFDVPHELSKELLDGALVLHGGRREDSAFQGRVEVIPEPSSACFFIVTLISMLGYRSRGITTPYA